MFFRTFDDEGTTVTPSTSKKPPTVIPAQDSLIADLLNLDLGGGSSQQYQPSSYAPAPVSSGLDDLLGLGSDSLLGPGEPALGGTASPTVGITATTPPVSSHGLLGDLFGANPPTMVTSSSAYVSPKQVTVCFSVWKNLNF